MKKTISPIPTGIQISCLKTMLLMMKKHLFMREDTVLARVCLIKYLLPAPLEVQQIDVLENPMCFPTLDLKKKLISSENTFRSLCGMVAYKILMSKVEIDLALFLKLIFFQFSDNWKIFLHKPEFLTGRTKKEASSLRFV